MISLRKKEGGTKSRPKVCWIQMRGLKWLVLCILLCFYDLLFILVVAICPLFFLTLITFLSISSCQVLQRKTEEAFAATKILKDMIATRKAISHKSTGWKTRIPLSFLFALCWPHRIYDLFYCWFSCRC